MPVKVKVGAGAVDLFDGAWMMLRPGDRWLGARSFEALAPCPLGTPVMRIASGHWLDRGVTVRVSSSLAGCVCPSPGSGEWGAEVVELLGRGRAAPAESPGV